MTDYLLTYPLSDAFVMFVILMMAFPGWLPADDKESQ